MGGIVRDALLDRPLGEVDLVVQGEPEGVARRIARAYGGPAFALSDEFGAWRAMDRARTLSCDVSPLQGQTIEDDLRCRDFTVNAIAVPLAGGAPVDPTGGI